MGRPILAWIKRLCDHVIGLLGAENGTPSQLQVSATRRDFREACKLLGIDPIDAGEAIHAAKADRRLFGNDQVPTPVFPNELDARARQAGLKFLIENYTVVDEETGNPAKSYFGAKD